MHYMWYVMQHYILVAIMYVCHYCLCLQIAVKRHDLKIVIMMDATPDVRKFQNYFNNAPLLVMMSLAYRDAIYCHIVQ